MTALVHVLGDVGEQREERRRPDHGQRVRTGQPVQVGSQLITEIQHQLVDVIGGAVSFFSEPLNGIVRTEME
jgi:hypothetical protein